MAYKDKSAGYKYVNEYNSKKYDRVNLLLPKGEADLVKDFAQSVGMSLNGYIVSAIHERLVRDGYQEPGGGEEDGQGRD